MQKTITSLNKTDLLNQHLKLKKSILEKDQSIEGLSIL